MIWIEHKIKEKHFKNYQKNNIFYVNNYILLFISMILKRTKLFHVHKH